MCETVNSSLKYSWSDDEKATFAARSTLDGKGLEEGCQLFQRNTRPPQQLHHPPTQAWSGSELQYFSSSVSLFLKKNQDWDPNSKSDKKEPQSDGYWGCSVMFMAGTGLVAAVQFHPSQALVHYHLCQGLSSLLWEPLHLIVGSDSFAYGVHLVIFGSVSCYRNTFPLNCRLWLSSDYKLQESCSSCPTSYFSCTYALSNTWSFPDHLIEPLKCFWKSKMKSKLIPGAIAACSYKQIRWHKQIEHLPKVRRCFAKVIFSTVLTLLSWHTQQIILFPGGCAFYHFKTF